MEMKSVEELDVFKLAHELALKTYSTTKVFPREETFSLVDQMSRAAASVGMNLMEGVNTTQILLSGVFVGRRSGSGKRGSLFIPYPFCPYPFYEQDPGTALCLLFASNSLCLTALPPSPRVESSSARFVTPLTAHSSF
jgi:hypothetical protein